VTPRDERGATLPLVALLIVVLMGAVGFTVDLGSLAARTRRLQGLADVVSLDAAKELNGQACSASYTKTGEAVASTQYDHVVAAAVASASRNGHVVAGNKTLAVELGLLTRYPDDSVAGHTAGEIMYTSAGKTSFTPIPSCASSSTVPDAVRVTTGDRVDYGFSRAVGYRGANPTRSAIGMQRPIGSMSIGSSVGTFDSSQSVIMNALLGAMFCPPPLAACNASVGAVGYNGLASTNITLGALAAAMGFGTVDGLLNANVTASQVFSGAATALTGSTVAAIAADSALGSLATSSTGPATFKLKDFITVQQGGTDSSGNDVSALTEVNLLTLVQASGALSNGSSAVTVPSAAITLPAGISSLTAKFDLVEGPKVIVGQPGIHVDTKQVRLTLTPTFNVSVANFLPATVGVVTGSMPIVVSGGLATGTIKATSCYTGSFPTLTTSTTVQAATSSVTGTLTVKTLGGIALGTLNMTGTGVSTTTGTFVDEFDYTSEYDTTVNHGNHLVGLSAINFGSATFTPVVGPTITAPGVLITSVTGIIGTIDSTVVVPLTNLLGVSLGSADIMALKPLICNAPTVTG
jgi:uncharacterized membrane protein